MNNHGPERAEQLDHLRWYIEKYSTPYGDSTVPLSDTIRKVLPPSGRLRAKQLATQLSAPWTKRRVRDLPRTGLRLHLGCGALRKEGWVNIDLIGARGADLIWDLRKPLPLTAGSADAVFLEHVFEHMTYGEALRVLELLHPVLAPGGILRVGVPDAGMYSEMYVRHPGDLRSLRWGRPTAMLALREVFQEHGHVAAYDGETLLLVLEAGGFPGAEIRKPGESALDVAPDSAERVDETVYVEVIKT